MKKTMIVCFVKRNRNPVVGAGSRVRAKTDKTAKKNRLFADCKKNKTLFITFLSKKHWAGFRFFSVREAKIKSFKKSCKIKKNTMNLF